ncbi:PTS sugar transporter subunit IIA [Sandarakinorhabdus sp.]|uniref:PTS sugar transporter subunit IIA n=1 Tax=Sandarakinorhabdus sp. TaxID=1916663 RepID=UPI003341FA53
MPYPGLGTGFAGLVVPGGVIPALPALSRDAALLALAGAAAGLLDVPSVLIAEQLQAREAKGSTAFGRGAAIPHAHLAGLARCCVLLARLPQPVDWQASDGEAVDVAVLLLSPRDAGADHLKALARISRTLRDSDAMAQLRQAQSVPAMLAAVTIEAAAAA